MRRRELTNKMLAYACVSALAVSSMAGYTVYTAKAADGIEVQALQFTQEQEAPNFVAVWDTTDAAADGYKYMGYVGCDAASQFKYLQITYRGDAEALANARLEFMDTSDSSLGVFWGSENAQGTLTTTEGTALPVATEEEQTVIIDLEASGIDTSNGISAFHVHANDNVGSFEITEAKFLSTEEEEIVFTQEQEAPNFVAVWDTADAAADGYKYMGYVGCDAASQFKYLQITYRGDAEALANARLEFMDTSDSSLGVFWGSENAQGTLTTTEGTALPAATEEEQTVIIDLEASGIDTSNGISAFHIHGNDNVGSFEITEAKFLSTEAAEEESTDGEEEITTSDEEESSTEELPTVAEDDIILNGTDSGSSMVGTYKISESANQYKYLGFASLKDATADYKYLAISYTGDITSVRFEFAMVGEAGETAKSAAYWFNAEGQTNYFVTADESDIPLDGGNGTTIVIDLEKTGINLADYNGVHMHAGYGKSEDESKFPEVNFAITNARLSKTSDVKDSDKETVTQTPTTQSPTKAPAKPQPTTKAPETTKAVETTKAPETTAIEVKKPGKVKIKAATKAKKAKKAKITLKKIKKAKGYEVRISTSKKFKKKITIKKFTKKINVTFKKLKKNKKYFVKARAYVLDANGKKVFGKWSKVKAVTAPKKSK